MSIFSKLEREVKKGISRLGDSIKGEIKNLGHDIEGGIKSAGNTIKHEVEGVGKKAIHEVEGVGKKSVIELQNQAKNLTHEIEDIAQKAIDELEDEVANALNSIFKELSSQAFGKGVNTLRKLEKIGETALSDASCGIGLSVVNLVWNDLGGRVSVVRESIEDAMKSPPALNRDYIYSLINAVAPDRVGINLDFSLAALVVTSDAAGAKFALEVSTPAFLEAGDEILEAIGI